MIKYLIIILLLSSAVVADDVLYNWNVIKVIDGDTIQFEAPWVPKPLKPVISVRVFGVDTPEKAPKNKCQQEDEMAQKATTFTKEAIANAKNIRVSLKDWDKYAGRVLGIVVIDGISLGEQLLKNKLARPYFGGKKEGWCN